MKPGRGRNAAFATLMAVALIGMVGIALTAISASVSSEMVRTRHAITATQARQLLLAGYADASARAPGWTSPPASAEWVIPVPDDLREQGFALQGAIERTDDTTVHVRISVQSAGRRTEQLLSFRHTESGWVLESATAGGL